MDSEVGKRLPKGWGDDKLSHFLEVAHGNRFASFVQLRADYALLVAIDECYRKAAALADHSEHWLPALFMLRSHSGYLAAVSLAMSGQVPEAHALIRSFLENALYGHYIFKNPEVAELWLGRHDSEQNRKRQRSELRLKPMLDELAKDDEKVGQAASQIYEWAIDYGAHPNERSVTLGLSIGDTGQAIKFESAHLAAEPQRLRFGLRSYAQGGICCLDIFRLVLPERFRLTSLDSELNRLRRKC